MHGPAGKQGNVVRRSMLIGVAAAAFGAGMTGTASAQVPALPQLPAPVQDALVKAEETLSPILVQVAAAAQPIMTAGGFALRPVCGAPGTSPRRRRTWNRSAAADVTSELCGS